MAFDDTSHGRDDDGDDHPHKDMDGFVDALVRAVANECDQYEMCTPCAMKALGILALSKWVALYGKADVKLHGYHGSEHIGVVMATQIKKIMDDISRNSTTYFVEECLAEVLQYNKEHGT